MNVYLEKADGTRINSDDYNMIIQSWELSAPEFEHSHEDIGIGGFYDMGTKLKSRKAAMGGIYTAIDGGDNVLLQNEIIQAFDVRHMYKIIDSRNKGLFLLGKIANAFTPKQKRAVYGEFDIDFICQPFRYSYGTSLTPLTFDSEAWMLGQGLNVDPNAYRFTTANFTVQNIGTEEIDKSKYPFDYMTIEFKGASTNLKIKNNTTGQEWSWTGTTAAADTIKLDGVMSFKNNLSIFHNSNRKVIKLKPGANSFTVTGATGSFELKFDLRFKYL